VNVVIIAFLFFRALAVITSITRIRLKSKTILLKIAYGRSAEEAMRSALRE
jgi:hypothetical protein